jgi:hypothetical protein
MAKIEYVSFQDKVSPSDWRVEAIDDMTGEVYITLFAGPDAEERSVEYASFKNGTHPIFKKAAPVVPAPPPATAPMNPIDMVRAALPNTIHLVTDNGHEIMVTPSEVKWNYDARRKVLTGRPRPAIEIQKGFTPKG